MRFTLHATLGDGEWYVFVPDEPRSPINRVTLSLSYAEWLERGSPHELFVQVSTEAPE